MSRRICVVGAGLAGTLLAWRLASRGGDVEVDLVDGVGGPGPARDATAASGGLVRGYETDAEQRRLATESLAELLGSAVLRGWSGYRRAGSAYVLRAGPAPSGPRIPAQARAEPTAVPDDRLSHLTLDDLTAELADLHRLIPGSARLAGPADLTAAGWSGLPPTAVAVLEDSAGFLSPDRFRAALLADFARGRRGSVIEGPLQELAPAPHPHVLCGAGRRRHDYDLVVLATGAWTPTLLDRLGLAAADAAEPRTKAIQYSIHRTRGRRPPPFVDETTGLYGRPTSGGGMLLGVPTSAWHVDADRVPADPTLPDEALRLARSRFPALRIGPAVRVTAAADCYTCPSGLALRAIPETGDRLFTFTGGSGGSAKTALAASGAAAGTLLGLAAGAPTGAPAGS